MRSLLDKHYPVEYARKLHLFDERCLLKDEMKPSSLKKAYIRGASSDDQFVTCVAGITCALGRQLLEEHDSA